MKPELERYAQEWGLSDQRPLTSTTTSWLYLVTYQGKPAVLKVLTPLGALDEKLGAPALQRWSGEGAVRLYRFDEGAHLLEYVEGPTLAEVGDREADLILVDLVARLHSQGQRPPVELTPLQEYSGSLFQRGGADPEFTEGARVARALLESSTESFLLHGDLHHDNVLRHPDRGWLVLDPKGVRGERAFDLANWFYNPQGRPTEERLRAQLERFSNGLEIDRTRLLDWVYAYGCLSLSWCLDDGVSIEGRASTLQMASALRA